MKKTTVIALVFGILISCGNNQTVSEIDNFVSTINNRNDLIESITEFNTEDLSDDMAAMKRAVAFCQVIEPSGAKARTHKVSSKNIANMFQDVV